MNWKDIFYLVDRMWDVKQSKIAEYLGVDRSTITRLINGTQPRFAQSINEVYRNLFDPTNPKSPAYSKEPDVSKKLLKELKSEIYEADLADATKNLDDSNYEKFVMGLLRLVKENQPLRATKQKNTSYTITQNKKQTRQTTKTHPEKMSHEFYRSSKDFAIEDFIDSNPVDSLSVDRIMDAVTFVGHIKYKHEHEDDPDKNRNIYQDIIKFITTLLEYVRLLTRSSADSKILPEHFVPVDANDYEFIKKADDYRHQLKSLLQKINIDIEAGFDEEKKNLRDLHKKMWEESIRL